MICENCGGEHDGSYGSGRFCSKACRGAFCVKQPKKHKNFEPYECCYCHAIIFGRNALYRHKKEKHPDMFEGHSWNAGKTKETDERIAKGVKTFHKNMNDGKWIPWMKGKHLSKETREKISKSMKRAHNEGRAHNIGECRWNNEPSYPEKWFMTVIDNEFDDKNYVREFPFYKFSLDFVWKDKKKVIEIDGEQHYRDEKQILRDKQKNEFLKNDGWKLLRLDWRWVFHNSKEAIKQAKEFIDYDD